VINKIKNILLSHFKDSEAIYLFGSFANNTFNKNSDIDIAILYKHPIPPLELFNKQNELFMIFNKDIDLIDLQNADLVFSYEIINHSIKLKTSKYSEDFENRIWWNYLTFQDDRKIIVEAFLNDR
jgi:predicted nucleotidyltransferase